MATSKKTTTKTKTKKDLFKNAFINKDKDFYKDVYINIDGEEVWLAKIKHITNFEQSGIIFKLNSGAFNGESFNEDDIDKIELLYHKTKISLVEWAFDEPITIDNIKYLDEQYFTPIFNAISELETVWQNKLTK